ncbi:glycosyl transferase [Candidatus Woesearchaeota archaeon CG10_big_fil_rev_8_21_14_0_10_44_13]|nr:MAG: glycosyl transferase [Candidatus Woesearchaeota archaeon CG10_big_fil_rev_8_21_14_0_10_44_13]
MSAETAVIIVNWNGKHLLGPCLKSLRQQTYRDFSVFVVDNNSDDGSADFVMKDFPETRVIALKKNTGFTGGNNAGFRETAKERRIKYIVTLNNDTVVDRRWLENLVKAARSDRKIGSCSSKVLYLHDKDIIDTAGIAIYQDGHAQSRHGLEKSSACTKKEEIFGASAVAALYKMEAIRKTGFFDGMFYMYQEEVDLAWRLRYAGYKSIFVPSAVVYHAHSASSKPFSPLKAYYSERNRIWLVFKNFPCLMLLRSPYYTIKRYIALSKGAREKRGAAGEFVKRYSSFRIFTVLAKAYFIGILGIPLFVPKRIKIQMMRIRNSIDANAFFRRFSTDAEKLALIRK